MAHRQSVVHSLVEYVDNSVIAQLGVPDMRIPIQYALTYPNRFESPVASLSLTDYINLTFEKPDYETFECISHCKKAIARGGLYTAAVNSANEAANALFREGKIKFLEIGEFVGEALENAPKKDDYSLEDVLETDKWAKQFIEGKLI
ncbi:1-deoxy-D-xylulose 5-phosphate reductoisomerase [bioreactor metagenome]|uniref:1-deoxy-D-xylulose 5-phosphate reductoisomerase n=1 Tax=bioreactor metagenome TaxID=1076179 RepID=A0A645E265_9ZZZZ